jgi:flagellar export protein FliJ
MAQFQFRLTSVLRLRESIRDQRRSQLAEAYQAEAVLQQQRNQLLAEIQALRKQYQQAAAPGTLDADRLLDVQRYELVTKSQLQALDEQQQRLSVEIERRREALVAADRDVRVLEKLRETQRAHHQHEEHLREVKQWDELAGQRHAREEATT